MKFNRDNKYLAYGLTAFVVIAASLLFYSMLTRWEDVRNFFETIFRPMSPIFIGMIIAYLLTPLMNFCERFFLLKFGHWVFPRREKVAVAFSRALAVFLSIMLLIAFLVGLVMLVIPQLAASAEKLVSNSNMYLDSAQNWVNDLFKNNAGFENTAEQVITYIVSQATSWLESSIVPLADTLWSNISAGLMNIVSAIFDLFIGIIVSAYLMYSKETFQRQTINVLKAFLSAKRVKSIQSVAGETHRLFGGFLLGKVLSAMLVGTICAIFMAIVGMPYIALISVLVAVTNIIPFIGPFIGAVPSAFLLLLDNPVHCLIFVIFIIVLQQIDGNILSAKIVGNTTGLSGFWVIVAVFVSGALFGFAGMVFGLPVFALIYHAISRTVKKRLIRKERLEDSEEDISDKLL